MSAKVRTVWFVSHEMFLCWVVWALLRNSVRLSWTKLDVQTVMLQSWFGSFYIKHSQWFWGGCLCCQGVNQIKQQILINMDPSYLLQLKTTFSAALGSYHVSVYNQRYFSLLVFQPWPVGIVQLENKKQAKYNNTNMVLQILWEFTAFVFDFIQCGFPSRHNPNFPVKLY